MARHRRSGIAAHLNRLLVIAIVCFLTSVCVSLYSITVLSNNLTTFIDNEYKVATSISAIMRGNQGMGRHLCQMILYTFEEDSSGMVDAYEEVIEYRSVMESSLQTLSQLGADSVDHEAVDAAIAEAGSLNGVIDKIHDYCIKGQADEAWDLYKAKYAPSVTSIRETITGILANSDKSAQARIEQKDRLTQTTYVLTIVVSAGALTLLALLTSKLSHRITDPIEELEEASDQLRHGSLNAVAHYKGDDELGALCTNFNEACRILATYVNEIAAFADAINRGKLNYMSSVEFLGDFQPIGESLEQLSITLSEDMAKIAASAEQVYSGAEQMSSVGTRLSQSAVEQASSVQELVATVNTVSDHVTDNASTALEVRDNANALYDSMSQYSVMMKDVNRNMAETRAMTDKVRGIVRNLETISFQTNTLALNAAVEAARAGDSGRGFAVIANEIRELAGEASRAATNTSILLGDMITKISTSSDMSERAIGSLDSILSAGNTTATNVDKISNASNSQATALTQVRRSINELSQNIQSISSTAEESAASAEELQGQMKLLNQLVDFFEIRKHI